MTNVSGSDARASTIGSPRHANHGVHGVAPIADDYSTPRPTRTVVLTQADLDVFNAPIARAKRDYYGGEICTRCNCVMAAEGRHHCRPDRKRLKTTRAT